MNWEAIGAIGEVLGALGVIATLGYLAFQIRQNNSLLAAQASYAQFSVERERRTRILENRAGLTDISIRASLGEELSRTESLQLDAYWRDILDAWQWQFRERQAGRLQSELIDFESWRVLWELDAGLQKIYRDTVNRRDADFVQFMEANVTNR